MRKLRDGTIRTYGRHKNRVIVSDVWLSDNDKNANKGVFSTSSDDSSRHGSVFHTSSSSSDSMNTSSFSRCTRQSRNKENVKQQAASNKKKSNKTKNLQSLLDTDSSVDNTRATKTRVLRDRNRTVDYNSSGNNVRPTRGTTVKRKRQVKVSNDSGGKEISLNFSEFDNYSLVVSDSSSVKEKAHSVETSTPVAKRTRCKVTPDSKIKVGDISHIEMVVSPSSDVAYTSIETPDSNHSHSIFNSPSMLSSVYSGDASSKWFKKPGDSLLSGKNLGKSHLSNGMKSSVFNGSDDLFSTPVGSGGKKSSQSALTDSLNQIRPSQLDMDMIEDLSEVESDTEEEEDGTSDEDDEVNELSALHEVDESTDSESDGSVNDVDDDDDDDEDSVVDNDDDDDDEDVSGITEDDLSDCQVMLERLSQSLIMNHVNKRGGHRLRKKEKDMKEIDQLTESFHQIHTCDSNVPNISNTSAGSGTLYMLNEDSSGAIQKLTESFDQINTCDSSVPDTSDSNVPDISTGSTGSGTLYMLNEECSGTSQSIDSVRLSTGSAQSIDSVRLSTGSAQSIDSVRLSTGSEDESKIGYHTAHSSRNSDYKTAYDDDDEDNDDKENDNDNVGDDDDDNNDNVGDVDGNDGHDNVSDDESTPAEQSSYESPKKKYSLRGKFQDLQNSFSEILTPPRQKNKPVPQLSAYARVLVMCDQTEPITFKTAFPNKMFRQCKKIGDGVYGEVFRSYNHTGQPVAIKVIPIEGDFTVNDEPQKKFAEILPEIVIAKELSQLRENKSFTTSNFCEVNSVSCVKGKYPAEFIKQWDIYYKNKGSENDRPDYFPDKQLYIVFEFADCGSDLETYKFDSIQQAKSVLTQVTYALAVAEQSLQFEHRDLHWGNVLIKPTDAEDVSFKLMGKCYNVPSFGVEANIIDFTLSRLTKDGCTVFTDLSTDDSLFEGKGDYQFDVYRAMKKELKNKWDGFCPRNNVLWLHYLADKLVYSKQYPSQSDRSERETIRHFRRFLKDMLNYQSSAELTVDAAFINS